MKRLRYDFLKDRNNASQSAYRKQCNKKQYFSNLETKLITDKKSFCEAVKSLSSDKIIVKEIINLSENGKILSSDTDVADAFNDYFSIVLQSLNIPMENSMLNTDLCINSVLAVVEKYKHHQNVISVNR